LRQARLPNAAAMTGYAGWLSSNRTAAMQAIKSSGSSGNPAARTASAFGPTLPWAVA
jgi:hypothetical protein